MAPFTVTTLTPSGPLASTRRHLDFTELDSKPVPDHFGALMLLNQLGKDKILSPVGVINPDYQVEIGLLLHLEGEKTLGLQFRMFLRVYLSVAHPGTKVNGTGQETDGRTTYHPKFSGMKVSIIPLGKKP